MIIWIIDIDKEGWIWEAKNGKSSIGKNLIDKIFFVFH